MIWICRQSEQTCIAYSKRWRARTPVSDTGLGLQQVGAAIQALNKRLGWVWWFSLGALLATVGHRL
ncbi:hypothetical protein WT09_24245 [Burkholderia stagnalis]|nr:hypothetical protein WT09_24245 [Burkholderia stagnalis]